jgi:DNA-binding IclR family transcriptional regulator
MANAAASNGRQQLHRPTQTVQRAFGLLDLLGQADKPLPLTEVAARAGLHPSTCLRLLRTAESHGFVERLASSGHYRLGAKIFTLAYGLERQLDIRALVRPVLQHLAETIHESASLVIHLDNEAMVLERVIGKTELGFQLGVGARGPLYCTAAGKALIAFGDPSRLEDVLQGPLPRLTATTLTDPAALRADIERTRERGYSIDNCEREDGLFGLAAPVWDAGGRLIGVVASSGPSERLNTASLPSTIDALLAAAADMSARLGHTPPSAVPEGPAPPRRDGHNAVTLGSPGRTT